METLFINIILSLIILLVVGLASAYIYREKKKGTRCIGCPAAGNCKKACQHSHDKRLVKVKA